MKSLLIAFTVFLFLGSCGSVDTAKDVPPLTVPAYQETVYTGNPQPIDVQGTPSLELCYFSSMEALGRDEDGSGDAPFAAGVYYVRVRRAGASPADDLIVEYHIEKAPVTIMAEPVQEAVYNGSPKSVTAASEPPLGLRAVYYPTRAAREAAANSPAASEILRGFTRVERAPIEPGTYYVTVYYPGDANYRYAKLDIELTIHPAARRPARQ
ncbi:MAG: hypothetical protein LBI85_01150 [Spirochaetaceae bacterium]|nr:hypothetical protein [Spirochaetaceae bacterium]